MTGIVVLIFRILAVISLYAFLGWALITLWRELQLTSSQLTSPQFPSVTITPLDFEDLQTREYQASEVMIGRDEGCEYTIPDDTVSSRHARLSYHHSQWWLEDLLSKNGTYLNDERVYTSTVIISGDELRCGKVNLRITIKNI
ncbi:MAG: FHA domain-containing protein [Anaerolineaceae bacterium]|nr:FHA domain-containing protein [Anaerolineaceae bacterium]